MVVVPIAVQTIELLDDLGTIRQKCSPFSHRRLRDLADKANHAPPGSLLVLSLGLEGPGLSSRIMVCLTIPHSFSASVPTPVLTIPGQKMLQQTRQKINNKVTCN